MRLRQEVRQAEPRAVLRDGAHRLGGRVRERTVARAVDDGEQQRVAAAACDRRVAALALAVERAVALADVPALGARRAPGERPRGAGRRARARARGAPHGGAHGRSAARHRGDREVLRHPAHPGKPQAERPRRAVVVAHGERHVRDPGTVVRGLDADLDARGPGGALDAHRAAAGVLVDVGGELGDHGEHRGPIGLRQPLQYRRLPRALQADHRVGRVPDPEREGVRVPLKHHRPLRRPGQGHRTARASRARRACPRPTR